MGADDPFDIKDQVIGTEVGGYKVERELGRGGMGVVYAATHPVIGKRAAIKVLKPSLSKNPATVERFLQEARSVNQIGHPGIVDIFAFGELPDGRRYLVMDLLEGESLRSRVKRGPLHVSEAAQVIDEMASALIAAHNKGFIHRDLKPDNVFLVAHPNRTDIRLLDFGLAKLKSGDDQRAYRTATGAQLGTPDYMSPEQLRSSSEVDERCDVYALGITAFEILYGKRPRRLGDGAFDLDRPPIEILKALPLVPEELAQLVAQMIAGDPNERPTLTAVRAVLKRLRAALPALPSVVMEAAAPPSDDQGSIDLTASAVGARPMLPSPPMGSPLVPSVPPPAPAPTPPVAAGLARTSGIHASTRIGVPPPPVSAPVSATFPRSPPAAAPRSESKVWIMVGIVLVVGAALALVLVLAL